MSAVRAYPTIGGSLGNAAIMRWRVKPVVKRVPIATSTAFAMVGVSNLRRCSNRERVSILYILAKVIQRFLSESNIGLPGQQRHASSRHLADLPVRISSIAQDLLRVLPQPRGRAARSGLRVGPGGRRAHHA